MFSKNEIKEKLDCLLESRLKSLSYIIETSLDEATMKRVVRKGKIVKKVKIKRKGFKVLRTGNKVKFVRMTQKEKRVRRKAARKAWRVGKGARKNKSRRTMIRSKVRIRQLYGRK